MAQQSKPANEDFVMGIHAVQELVKSAHPINRLYVEAGARDRKVERLVQQTKKKGVIVQPVPKQKLDQMTDHGVHQGVVAAVAAYEYATIDDLFQKAEAAGEDSFFLILDGIKDPHNLGSMLRTADVAGVHGIIIPNRRAAGLTTTVAKISTGAIEHVPVARVTNISRTIEELKSRGVWVFGTDMAGQNVWEMDATLPLAVVIGEEEKGISPGVKKHLDGVLTIPMKGHMQSLNASVAAALLMYEVYRKRSK